MPLKVLGMELASIYDVIRLLVNLKKEKSGLIAYKYNDEYHIGFYFPPLVKKVNAVYAYTRLKEPPEKIYSYSPNDAGSEKLVYEYVESPNYINIVVGLLKRIPHIFINPIELEVDYDYVETMDLLSLISIAYTTHLENILIPFLWYDISSKEYILNVEASSNDERSIILFTYKGESNANKYIEIDYKNMKYSFVSVPADVSKRYILVIDALSLPFRYFKKKS